MLATCGEEILKDMWMFHIIEQKWTFVKPSYNAIRYLDVKVPKPRYGHTASYVQLYDPESLTIDDEPFLRKYMYIYGGFSFECQTACLDLWRYEIAYGPMAMYPASTEWKNTGNHWVLLTEDANYGPGPRWRHSMAVSQYFPDENQSRDSHVLYIFGGIKVLDYD